MGKKKREHIVFDRMLKPKLAVPFALMNRKTGTKPPADSVQRRKKP